jgi:hypothetical protein
VSFDRREEETEMFTVLRTLLCLLVLSVALAGSAAGAPGATPLNVGAGLRWHGYVATDLKFSEYFSQPHTVMARFMPQYVRAYRGPIFGTSGSCSSGTCVGGTYSIGVGNFSSRTPSLVLDIAGSVRRYPFNLREGEWYHLAVTRTNEGNTAVFRLYINGKPLCGTPLPCHLRVNSPVAPSGFLRIGRTWVADPGPDPSLQQFYGFVDDVAIYNTALEASAIASAANSKRLTGSETGPLVAYSFDKTALDGKTLGVNFKRPATFLESAVKWPFLSHSRDAAFDARNLPLAADSLALRLPFRRGEAWTITQGYSQGPDFQHGSHVGIAAFSIDAVRYKETTLGASVYSSAKGRVVYIRQNADDSAANCSSGESDCGENLLQIRLRERVIASYRHLGEDSIESEGLGLGSGVNAGVAIAEVGNHPRGAHLHFGFRNNHEGDAGDTVTFPVVYKNYELLVDAKAGGWAKVKYGVPKKGDVVRVP